MYYIMICLLLKDSDSVSNMSIEHTALKSIHLLKSTFISDCSIIIGDSASVIPDLTIKLRSKIRRTKNFIYNIDNNLLPYPKERISVLFIRKCYVDIYALILAEHLRGVYSFAISGSPGGY